MKIFCNKANGRISKLVTRKQSTPNFPKNEHFLPRFEHFQKKLSWYWKCLFQVDYRAEGKTIMII